MAALPADFREGVRDVAPVVGIVLPYGLVVGATAVAAGFSTGQAIAFSGLVNAGAAQLAAIGLLDADAPLLVAVFTALVINLRLVMYSASLAPYLDDEPLSWRAAMAHLVIDPTYAMGVIAFDDDRDRNRRWYFLGLGFPLLLGWVLATGLGAVVGARVPEWLPLSFAIPMVFLALLVQALGGRATVAAAVVGALVAVAGAGLPYNLGLIVGAVAGIVAGLAIHGRAES